MTKSLNGVSPWMKLLGGAITTLRLLIWMSMLRAFDLSGFVARNLSSPAIQEFRNSGFQILQPPPSPQKNSLRKSRRAMQANEVHAGAHSAPRWQTRRGRMGPLRPPPKWWPRGTPFCHGGRLRVAAAAEFSLGVSRTRPAELHHPCTQRTCLPAINRQT